MSDKPKTEIWVCLDKDGYPVFTAGWKEACHEHINDAVLHDKSAGKWVVRQVTELPAKTESVLIENIAYTVPAPVAYELLDLHIRLRTQAAKITELESQVEALRKDAEWQPIETAPKDGALFDAWAAESWGVFRVTDIKWGRDEYAFPGDAPCFLECRPIDDEPWRNRWQNCERNLTHWMPIPEPPTT